MLLFHETIGHKTLNTRPGYNGRTSIIAYASFVTSVRSRVLLSVAPLLPPVPVPRLHLQSEAIPQALEWGQVLINIRAAPINPADMFPTAGAEVWGTSLMLFHLHDS